MKEACEGAYRESAWKCAMEMVVHLFLSPVSLLLQVPLYVLCSYTWFFINLLPFIVSYSPPQSLSLGLSLTLSLSFCHNSKYPVGPGCRLLVLVYLALGSIRLQAEASHSSQSHKMWLVLTTALQGDGLIGLIASDRLGWTLYRKTAATACCGFILPFLFPFSFFSITLYLLFSHSHLCRSLSPFLSLSYSLCLYIWLTSNCLSLNFISLFLFASYQSLTSLYAHKLRSSSQT